jgi:hypothetical protein
MRGRTDLRFIDLWRDGRAVGERATAVERPVAVGEPAGGQRRHFLLQPNETTNPSVTNSVPESKFMRHHQPNQKIHMILCPNRNTGTCYYQAIIPPDESIASRKPPKSEPAYPLMYLSMSRVEINSKNQNARQHQHSLQVSVGPEFE